MSSSFSTRRPANLRAGWLILAQNWYWFLIWLNGCKFSRYVDVFVELSCVFRRKIHFIYRRENQLPPTTFETMDMNFQFNHIFDFVGPWCCAYNKGQRFFASSTMTSTYFKASRHVCTAILASIIWCLWIVRVPVIEITNFIKRLQIPMISPLVEYHNRRTGMTLPWIQLQGQELLSHEESQRLWPVAI